MCEHIPKQFEPLPQKKAIRECSCGELCEYICMTCNKGLCLKCRDEHEHPVSVTTGHGYCTTCKKEIPIDNFDTEYTKTLPPFLPCNAKGIGLYLKHKLPKKIIVLTGAGISTSAGIPDFRTPGTGLYDNLEKYNLPTPESIFTLDYFDENPQPFFTLSKELMPGLGKYFPTPTHYFISFLAQKGLILKYLTQNIDGLEVQAGIPMDKLVLAHGHFYTGKCRRCWKKYEQKDFYDDIMEGKIAYCKCGGVIKPDIVFFGEALPDEFFESVDLMAEADLLLVLGTSLMVYPMANMVNCVGKKTPRVLLNMTDAGRFNKATDIKVLAKTDDSVFEIADYWGVGDEFRKFLDEKRLQEEKK